jgi:hypothetical protein
LLYTIRLATGNNLGFPLKEFPPILATNPCQISMKKMISTLAIALAIGGHTKAQMNIKTLPYPQTKKRRCY